LPEIDLDRAVNYIVALIFQLFRLPAIAQMLMAVPALVAAYLLYSSTAQKSDDLALALASEPPALLAIKDYDPKAEKNFAREVTLKMRADTQFKSELTQTRNGITTARRMMFVVFDASDPAESNTPRGVILFHPNDREKFERYFTENLNLLDNLQLLEGAIPTGRAPIVLTLNGRLSSSQGVGDVIDKAFEEYGFKRNQNFIHFEPFLDGREAGLATSFSFTSVYVFLILAVVFFALGLMRLRNGPAPAFGGDQVVQRQVKRNAPMPHIPAAQNIQATSGPLARIAQREEEERLAYIASLQPIEEPEEEVKKKAVTPKGPQRQKVGKQEAALSCGAVALAVVFGFFLSKSLFIAIFFLVLVYLVHLRGQLRTHEMGIKEYCRQCINALRGQEIEAFSITQEVNPQPDPPQTLRHVPPPIGPDGKIRIDHDPFAVIEQAKRNS
jgi:hypothetical protein